MARCQAHFQMVDLKDGAVLAMTTTWPVVMSVNPGRVIASLDVLCSLKAPGGLGWLSRCWPHSPVCTLMEVPLRRRLAEMPTTGGRTLTGA